MSIGNLQQFLTDLKLTKQQMLIGGQVLKEIRARVGFLIDVGLNYLSLARATGTLSGGEAQRIRLATQIGSGLVGVCYILDEPSIGLHQRDNDKLLNTLKNLRDLGNSLIVVEHDEDTMLAADHIVDIGPGAGSHGGEVVAQGTAEEIMQIPDSVTGQYLSGILQIPVPDTRKKPTGFLKIIGAAENNLKNVTVDIPLGVMTCVTGVSGSGKSSLVNEILYKHLAKSLNRARTIPGKHKEIRGIDQLDKVINIDQSPIGRTPRSNPATIPEYLTRSEICLREHRMPEPEAIRREGSALMLREADVKPAVVTGSSRSKCTSCRMCMYPVRSVAESVITGRHWMLNIRERVFMMCWR